MNWRRLIPFLRLIDPARGARVEQPTPPHALPPDKLRLHFFSATFRDIDAAEAFAYDGEPEPLTIALDGAYIDTNFVEVVSGQIIARLTEFMSPEEADDILLRMGADNTLFIITEEAFGGLPYVLDDTETLTYLGTEVVDV